MCEPDVVARRPQRAAGAVSGDRAKGGDAGHDRNGSAGARLDERIAAAFVMAAENEDVGGAVIGR